MKVYEAVVAALLAEGVDTAFGIMGDANLLLWGQLNKVGVALHAPRHEAAAVSMADGYAQATGRVGLVTVTCGPGLTHAATPLVSAVRARSPLVVVTGAIPRADRYNTQTFDHRRFVEACEAQYLEPIGVDDVAWVMRDAFYRAMQGRRPVVVSLPMEMQDCEVATDWAYRPSEKFRPTALKYPGAEDFSDMIDAIVAAKRPVIIGGRGAVGARDEIERVADQIGALLGTSLPAKDLFQEHPFNIGVVGGFVARSVQPLLAEADLVLAIGAQFGHHTSGEATNLFASAKVVRVDISPPGAEVGPRPALHVQADARKTARLIAEDLERRKFRSVGFQTDEIRRRLSAETPPSPGPEDGLDPRALMRNLSEHLPRDVCLTIGYGHYWTFPIIYLALPRGARVFFAYPFGAIGSGLPLAMGVATGAADAPQVLIEGDGSLLQNLQELETVVRSGRSLVVIVMNDAGYGGDAHKLGAAGFDQSTARWTSPDFVSLARVLGGDGIVLHDEADLGGAVLDGIAAGGLHLIDARISPTTMSDPYLATYCNTGNRIPLLRR